MGIPRSFCSSTAEQTECALWQEWKLRKRVFLKSNSPQTPALHQTHDLLSKSGASVNTDKHRYFDEKLGQMVKNPFYLRLHLPDLLSKSRVVPGSVVKKEFQNTLY